MIYRHLSEIFEIARKQESGKLVVAAAGEVHVLQAVLNARSENIIEPILVGDSDIILSLAEREDLPMEDVSILHEKDPARACQVAVKLINDNEADILMKGMVNTADLLKAVLDKETGLRKSELLSHAALFEVPGHPKLVTVTDAAMNVEPGTEEKVHIILNAVEIYHRLGVKEPRVAVLGPLETVNPKIRSTVEAGELKALHASGRISGCLLDGPLAMDNAVSLEAAAQKGIDGPVAGQADILLAPDLNSGNILYKTLIFMAQGVSAAVIMGARVPIVLTSRADSKQSKLMSIALAAALGSS
jgi:phosphate butyryltransferase